MKIDKVKKEKNFKIIAGVLVVTLAVYCAVIASFFSYSISTRLAETQKTQFLSYIDTVSREFCDILKAEKAAVDAVTERILYIKKDKPGQIFTILEDTRKATVVDDDISFVSLEGEEYSSIGTSTQQIKKQQEILRSGRVRETAYDIFTVGTDSYILINRAVFDENNVVTAVISASVSCTEFINTIARCGNKGNTLYMLCTSEGAIKIVLNRNKSYTLPGYKLFDALAVAEFDNNELSVIKNDLKIGLSSHYGFTAAGYDQEIFYDYTGFDDLNIVAIVDERYIDGLVSSQIASLQSLVSYITFGCVAFLIAYIIIMIIDRHKAERVKKELLDQSETDLLTGLLNKVSTENHIKAYLNKRPKDAIGAMFLIDLDNFKKVNDTLGHAFGDEVLKALGKALRKEFRVDDIVGRIGGDEFVVFVINGKSEESIRKEAARLELFFKDFRVGEYVKYAVTASVGIAMCPEDGTEFKDLYMRADQALYNSKDTGKNRISFYDRKIGDIVVPKREDDNER